MMNVNVDPQSPPPPEGGRARLLRQLRFVAVLVVVLVGVIGGNQIYQIRFAQYEFVVSVAEEFDLTGRRNQSMVDTADLLAAMDFELRVEGEPEPLLRIPAAVERSEKVVVQGRTAAQELRQGRARGELSVRGADPDRLRLILSTAEVRGDTLDYRLRHDEADDFLRRDIETVVAVQNQLGTPMTGLSSERFDLREDPSQPGVYRVGQTVDELLVDLGSQLETFSLIAEGDEEHFKLEVPLEWFVREGRQQHVLRVEEIVEFVPVLPDPGRLTPERVVAGTAWGGRLELAGRDLDLAEGVRLESSGRVVRCELLRKDRDRLALAVDPERLRPGGYDVVVETPQAPDGVRLAGALRVVAGLTILEPAPGAEVQRGDALAVRWSSSGLSGEILVEAERAGSDGQRWMVFRGAVEVGRCQWPTEGLDEGDYVLRVTLPGRGDLRPLQRAVTVLPPPELEVRLRFLLDGRPYANMREVRIDDERVDLGPDPMLLRLRLAPGMHRIRATGSLVQPYVGQIEVLEEGQLIDIVLQK